VKRVLLAIALAACGGHQTTETLAESIRSYNDGVRWQRYAIAAARLPAAERSRFVDEMDARAEELRIIDYDIVRVDARGPREARVQIKMAWFTNAEQILHETHAMQTWELHGKSWFLVDETHLRGVPMPGLVDRKATEPPPPSPDAHAIR
jgi:hypothetical protein